MFLRSLQLEKNHRQNNKVEALCLLRINYEIVTHFNFFFLQNSLTTS